MDALSPQPSNAELLQMVSRLFDHWQLAEEDRLALLGGADADDVDQLERVVHFLQIHKRLRQLYPQNLDLAYQWMTRPNKAFGGETPARFAQTADISALESIRSYLSHFIGQEGVGAIDHSWGSQEVKPLQSDPYKELPPEES